MNYISNKTTKPKIKCNYDASVDIIYWGTQNSVPQSHYNLAVASGITNHCYVWCKKFIAGQLFEDELKNDVVCSINGDTLGDIVIKIADDLAIFRGFALHINYNLKGEVDNINYVPFMETRLQAPDSKGYVSHVVRSTGWAYTANELQGLPTTSLVVYATKDNTLRYDLFNPDPEIVKEQIKNAGGINDYNGQILWVSMDGSGRYPKTRLHGIDHEVAATIKCSENVLRDALTGFMDITIFKTTKELGEGDKEEWENLISEVQGVDNGGKAFLIDSCSEEEMNNNMCEVLETGNSVKRMAENTAHSMRQIARGFMMPLEIVDLKDEAQGTFINRENMAGAFSKASMATREERELIARKLRQVFKHWRYTDKVIGSNNDFSIKPLRFNLTDEGAAGDDPTAISQQPKQPE